jgi:hypothetical protein
MEMRILHNPLIFCSSRIANHRCDTTPNAT